MAKSSVQFFCTSCGYESGKWLGRCPACSEWNTFSEAPVAQKQSSSRTANQRIIAPELLREVSTAQNERIDTQIAELNRVLGGGIVEGSAVLIGGDPGIGKSTLVLQMCHNLSSKHTVLYASGEESAAQIKMRAQRLGCIGDSLYLMCETNLDIIEDHAIKQGAKVLIVDSVQTLYVPDVQGVPGSISQVREATASLTRLAKSTGLSIIIIGHVTKQGAIAGPRLLEHLVDTVLYFESERFDDYRVLRTVKNRYGSTNEIGVFEMCEAGMREVSNPSSLFLSDRSQPVSGCAVLCAIEGTRPVMVEIQALCSRTTFGMPRRTSTGIDINRMSLLSAVLEKKLGLMLSDQDIYLNVAGGLKIIERCADLACCAAIASSKLNKALHQDMAGIGEVGLTGEIRPISHVQKRIDECKKMGYKCVIIPKHNAKELRVDGIEIFPVRNLQEALDVWIMP